MFGHTIFWLGQNTVCRALSRMAGFKMLANAQVVWTKCEKHRLSIRLSPLIHGASYCHCRRHRHRHRCIRVRSLSLAPNLSLTGSRAYEKSLEKRDWLERCCVWYSIYVFLGTFLFIHTHAMRPPTFLYIWSAHSRAFLCSLLFLFFLFAYQSSCYSTVNARCTHIYCRSYSHVWKFAKWFVVCGIWSWETVMLVYGVHR